MDFPVSQDDVPEVVGLQAAAVVDHVCTVDEDVLKQLLGNESVGGSRRAQFEDIQELLANVGEFHSKAGGSTSNTLRGLAMGFGVRCDMVGQRGNDEWGAMFVSSMKRAHVNTCKVRTAKAQTGRSVVLSNKGTRTMRTCMDDASRIRKEDLTVEDFATAKWALLSCYTLYGDGLLEAAVSIAKQAGCKIALDLASYEVVKAYRPTIHGLLNSRVVDCIFGNEDEAIQLMAGENSADAPASPEEALRFMASCCDCAVVTLGERGCIALRHGEDIVAEPAVAGVQVVDTTGAGDLFASGFLYGLLRGYTTRRCAQVGCLAGAAVVRTLGSELSAADWQWFHARLHGELAGAVVRDSAAVVHQEMLACYALVEKLGRGVVYYGSARLRRDSPHWGRAVELAREVARLLGCTTWSGGGPGMMQAASEGAMEAGCKVAGIRISREAGTAVLSASYLPEDCQVVCRFLSARKVALVDSGVRMTEADRTAYVFLPGGLGTMDELFEIMTLIQLRKLGSKLAVPLILANYDGFFDGLLDFLQACMDNSVLKAEELKDCVVANSNEEVLDYLAAYYSITSRPVPMEQSYQLASNLLLTRKRQRTNGSS